MAIKVRKIFDFDLTLTRAHTFGMTDGYETGKENAKSNIKIQANEYFLHDVDHLSSIATYHNDPAFIAGFVAELLGKELTFIETIASDVHGTAIDRYAVMGLDTPFLISYISTRDGEEYAAIVKRLCVHGKNEQLLSLRRVLLNEAWVEEGSVFDFYDDSENNYQCASQLPQINSYLVSAECPMFTVVEKHLCDPTQELGSFGEIKPHPPMGKRYSASTAAILNEISEKKGCITPVRHGAGDVEGDAVAPIIQAPSVLKIGVSALLRRREERRKSLGEEQPRNPLTPSSPSVNAISHGFELPRLTPRVLFVEQRQGSIASVDMASIAEEGEGAKAAF